MVQLTVSKTGERVDVSKGESFEISLPESPATGFRWKITANGEPVSRMTFEEFRPGTAVGGQGIHSWQFRAMRAGETHINMVLQRSWEASNEPAQTFNLRVVVAQ
jgi:predicted secreted protein